MRFHDRADAGRRLAARLQTTGWTDPVVLALPRGGVPVAYEVALVLGAPLEVFVARKVGAPGQPELGIGAIAEGRDEVVTSEAAAVFRVTPAELAVRAERERVELDRRVARYRPGPLPPLAGRDVVLVDDGLATGVTAEAALLALRLHRPARVVLAVPVAAPDVTARLRAIADEVVAVHTPSHFRAVGLWYDVFDQTSDAEVDRLLTAARSRAGEVSG